MVVAEGDEGSGLVPLLRSASARRRYPRLARRLINQPRPVRRSRRSRRFGAHKAVRSGERHADRRDHDGQGEAHAQ